jgi:hypothetical protein
MLAGENMWLAHVRALRDTHGLDCLEQPAPSARMRIGVPYRAWSGICANAKSNTLMWSAAVFAPALPGRSSPASASFVVTCTYGVPSMLGDLGPSTSPESQAGQALPCVQDTCRITMIRSLLQRLG